MPGYGSGPYGAGPYGVSDRRNSEIALGILVLSYPVFRLARQPLPVPSADPYVSQ